MKRTSANRLLQDLADPLSLRREVRQSLTDAFREHLTADMSVYDVGCGAKPFATFMNGRVKEYIGVDVEDGFYDTSHIDLIGDAYSVPVPAESADAVISSQVLEHLERPLDALAEAQRILKPNGLLFLSAPFIYPLHAAPRDFQRYTSFYWKHHLARGGFRIEDLRSIGGFWFCMAVFSSKYLQGFNRGPLKSMRIVSLIIWLMKITLLCLHSLEGLVVRLLGRDSEVIRAKWAINYVMVARKTPSLEAVRGNPDRGE